MLRYQQIISSRQETVIVWLNPRYIVSLYDGKPAIVNGKSTETTLITSAITEEGSSVDYRVLGNISTIAKQISAVLEPE